MLHSLAMGVLALPAYTAMKVGSGEDFMGILTLLGVSTVTDVPTDPCPLGADRQRTPDAIWRYPVPDLKDPGIGLERLATAQ